MTMVARTSVGATSETISSPVTYKEDRGVLGDGTPYLMRVPSNWNGTLIRDLDAADAVASSDPFLYLLERGYAVAGTARRPERARGNYDPAREIRLLDTVLDLFEERFDVPGRVIQYGCSGGGHVGQVIAEISDRVDGVIASSAGDRVWLANTYLDLWFVLKALIAPELPIVQVLQLSGVRCGTDYTEAAFAWRQALASAQRSAEGRARIALAVTIGQWPSWMDYREPKPDLNDVTALQRGMYKTVLRIADRPGGGAIRDMLESAAGFGVRSYQLSWNTGVDYGQFFKNGNEFQKQAVQQLYTDSHVSVDEDLERVNEFPSISAAPEARDYWAAAGRSVKGTPKIPVLCMHNIGDSIPVSLVQGYTDLVRENGRDGLVRVAICDSPTHGGFTTVETAVMVEAMNYRLDTGTWSSTEPDDLNEHGRSLDPSSTPRFIPFADYMPVKYNRTRG